jgi:hypothetical protein
MIVFNGIQLDTYENSLKGLIIKKSLSAIDNLSDRKGTASTEFDLPRTAKNELAFENIGTDGAQTTAIGDAQIYIDNNFYSAGKLYVRGYSDGKYRALFMGRELDLLAELKAKPMAELFDYTYLGVFTDAVIRPRCGSFGTTANGIDYAYSSPFNDSNEANSEFDKYHVAPCFKMVDLLELIFANNGITIESNALALPYFANALISDFSGHKAANTFAGATLTPTGNLNTGNIGNAVLSSNVTRSGDDYVLGATVSKLKVMLDIDYSGGDEVEYTQFFIDIVNNTGTPQTEYRTAVFESGGILQEGNNQFEIEFDETLSSGWYLNFRYLVRPKTGFTAPFTGYSLVVNNAVIMAGDADEGDYVYFGDYLPKYSQAEFISKFLKHFNLVLDINDTVATIELKDNGIQPNTANVALTGIYSTTIDITDKVDAVTDVGIEYVQASQVLLKQPFIASNNVKYIKTLPNQDFGSYLYNLDSFDRTGVQNIEGGFNTIFDDVDFLYSSLSYTDIITTPAPGFVVDIKNEWSNLIFHFTNFTASALFTYNATFNRDFQNQVGSPSNIATFTVYGGLIRMNLLWRTLFIGSLELIKDNKIKTVRFYDHLGTLASFQNRFVIKNQVYKLLEFQYDVQTKLVNAKMQLI